MVVQSEWVGMNAPLIFQGRYNLRFLASNLWHNTSNHAKFNRDWCKGVVWGPQESANLRDFRNMPNTLINFSQ